MKTSSNSTTTYRKIAMTTCLTGVVLAIAGFAMGGTTSVTWAGVIGAGIALILHGGIATIGALMTSARGE